MARKKSVSAPSRASLAAGFLLVAGFIAVSELGAQTASAEPDVLTFANGEKLIGHLIRSSGEKLTFKSDMAGEITVEWSKVKELRSSQRFAVVPKNVKLHHVQDAGTIPQGTIAVTDQKIAINPGAEHPAQTVAVADAAYVVDEVTFRKALHNPGLREGWKGGMTAGVSVVEATQNSRTFTGSVGLIRAIPSEEWLEPRNRTLFDFSASYGKLTQPNTPTVKTSIYHADGERDQYFSPRLYGFGQLSYDHNFSQGLDLQQAYGGGIGWTLLKSAKHTFDLKGGMTYVNQKFQPPAKSQNLIGSTIGERYTRILIHGLLFDEQLSVTPAWNNTKAYSAVGTAGLTLPVYKRLSVALSSIDTFLNDPPPGFKKNSFQFTTGIAYTLR